MENPLTPASLVITLHDKEIHFNRKISKEFLDFSMDEYWTVVIQTPFSFTLKTRWIQDPRVTTIKQSNFTSDFTSDSPFLWDSLAWVNPSEEISGLILYAANYTGLL